MIVAYVCVYSSTRSSKRSSIEKETRKPFALASTKAFFVLRSARKGRFPPSFRFTFIHENHPSDIIAQKCFPSLPLLSSFLRPARTRYEILFPSFSLCFPFSAFFASKRFALRRFVVAVFLSLSLSRGIPGGKSMDRHRAIFHASPLPLLFRARLFARETAEDFSFSRLFSFLDEMKRRAMISSHRLPLLPGRRRAKDRFGVSGKKYSRSSLSLSLSLFIFIIIHRTTNTKQNTAKKVVSKNNNNTVAKNAALLAATIATISSSGAALADDIEDVYAATYAKGRDGFGVRSPQRQAVDVNLSRKQAAPKPKFVKPVREEAPKPAKKESSGGGFSLPSISLPSISLPSFGGDAPATADE
jgi:hypothetical protein